MNKFTKNQMLSKMFKDKKELTRVAGVHDGISARIAEIAGFDAVWASGLGISAVNGVPDESILTMTEFLNFSIIINEATNLPVIADCDSGFGTIDNIPRLIRKYESYGISGICIEDKIFPKRNSFSSKEQILCDVTEFSEKIERAVQVKDDPNFQIIARVEALIAGRTIDEAVSRAVAYAEAGADAILIHSKKSTPDEIFEFASSFSKAIPIIIVPTKYPSITHSDIKRNNISVAIYANQALRASVKAMEQSLNRIIMDSSTLALEDQISTVEEIFNLQKLSYQFENKNKIYEGL